jgi:hypothetical protein
MKISEMDDEQIFELLMTSDFADGYTSDEWTFLMLKFRYAYRVEQSKHNSTKWKIEILEQKIEGLDGMNKSYSSKINDLCSKIDSMKTKLASDLSISERFTGKINWKDEN